MSERGIVVMSVRHERETIVLETAAGEVEIEIRPMSRVRNRVVVRAPREIKIGRRKREGVADDAV
jgi:hypothetical protein